jgi:DNA gyrase subunit A
VITIKVNDRNGPVVDTCLVRDTDEVILITNKGQLIRTPADDISVYGRNTQGVTVMETAEDEEVVSLARVREEDIEQGDEEEAETDEESDGAEVADESADDASEEEGESEGDEG